MKDINLLPEDIKSTNTYAPGNTSTGAPVMAIVVGIIVILLIGASILAPKFYIQSLEGQLDKIKKEVENPKYDTVKKVNADLASVNGLINSKGDIMETIDSKVYPVNEVLITLNSIVPKGCQITQMTYDAKALSISGKAEDRIVIAEFLTRIQRLDFLNVSENVTIDQSNAFSLKVIVGRKAGK